MSYIEVLRGTPDAHQRVQDWRRANLNGYILNVKSKSHVVLHKAACSSHFGDTEWQEGRRNWGSLGNNTKVLSTSKEDLVQWTKDRKADLDPCGSCQP